MFGNPEKTTGGRALKFYASIRPDIRRIQSIKEGDRGIGIADARQSGENKVAAPFREAEFDIIYGEGVSLEGDLLDLGVEKIVLAKLVLASFKGERMGQGRENARVFLKEHEDIRANSYELRKTLGLIATNGNVSHDESKKPNAEAEKQPAMAAAAGAAGAGKGRPTR